MNRDTGIEVKNYKLKVLPTKSIPSAILYIKSDTDTEATAYVTDINGLPYPLKGSNGIVSLTNTDGTIVITGSDNKIINLSTAIKNLIVSALQPGDNISELVNDVGYITAAEVPPTVTNLQSIASPTNVVIDNDNGSDATILAATTVNAGVLLPTDKVKLDNTTNINSGDQTSIVGITGTKSEYNASLTDGDFLFVGDVIAYTNEEAQDAVGSILLDTTTIDLTYDDSTPSISAAVKPDSITTTELANNINISEFVNNVPYATQAYVDSKIPENYSKIVYVNAVSPTTATIFDINNPPTINDNSLKTDVNNLYIGTDASTWVYITSPAGYITKTVTSGTSNFYLGGTTIDAGGNKITAIERTGTVGGAPATANNHFITKLQLDKRKTELSYACSDEVSDLMVGTLITFRMPVGLTLTAVKLSLNTAPTGSKVITDIRLGGVSIFSTLISADIGSTTSVGAAVPYVISNSNLIDDSIITILTTQVGSTSAGKGLKVTLIGNKI